MTPTIRIAALALSMTILWPPNVEGGARHRTDGPDNSVPAREECVVRWEKTPGDAPSLTAVSREACINQAQLAVEQPPLTVESIRRGPGGPHAISSRAEYCQFIPYKMHLKSPRQEQEVLVLSNRRSGPVLQRPVCPGDGSCGGFGTRIPGRSRLLPPRR